jgi:hypothetical protein
MSKKLLIILILLPFQVFCQKKEDPFKKFITINYSNIDSSVSENRSILTVWTSYLKNRIFNYRLKKDTISSKYWNDEENKLYLHPCLVFEIYPSLFFFHTYVLNIEPIGHNYYRILNCTTDSDSLNNVQIKAIYYILIKRTDDKYKLFNYYYLEKQKLESRTLGTIKFYFPKTYKFSISNAKKLVNFKDSLSSLFNLPTTSKLEYLVDPNTNSLLSHFGFIMQNYFTTKANGKCIQGDNILISSINENHRHELVHFFTFEKYPERNGFFDEGLAVYFGGSMGHDLEWHAKKFYDYFLTKMKSDTSQILKTYDIDRETNPQYTLGAILIKYAIDKYGFQKALKLLSYPQNKEKVEEIVSEELGIDNEKLNGFLLERMKEK